MAGLGGLVAYRGDFAMAVDAFSGGFISFVALWLVYLGSPWVCTRVGRRRGGRDLPMAHAVWSCRRNADLNRLRLGGWSKLFVYDSCRFGTTH